MAAVELATGYITLAVETSNLGKQLGKQFAVGEKVATQSGKRMGQKMAQGFEQSQPDLNGLRKEVETAEAKITASVERNATKQADAKRKVEIAQAKANEALAKYGKGSSQALTAIDRLATAEQKLEAASMAARAEQDKFQKELAQTRDSLREAEQAAEKSAQGTENAFKGIGGRIKAALSGDFKSAFNGLEGDAARSADGVAQEFTAAGDDAAEGFGDKFLGGLKGVAGAAAGLGIGLSLAEGIGSGMERERLGDRLAAQLNLTGPAAQRAGDVAGSLYAGAWGDSMDATHDAVQAVMSSIPGMMEAPQESLETTTAKALDLATAFDVDMNEAVGAVGVMMRNGLAEDADQAFDLMVGSLQKVPAGFRDELFPAITEYGKHFAGLGIDGATAMGLLVRGAENGTIGVDKMGDAIKEFQIRATDMSKTTEEAYGSIGLDMNEMTNALLAGGDVAEGAFAQIVHGLQGIDDPAAQSAAAIALFGTPLEDLSVNELPNFLGAIDPAGDAFDEFSGAAERMGDTLNNNAATNLESFKRTIGQGFTEIVGTAAGKLLDLGSAFKPVYEFLRDSLPQWGPFAAGIGAVATAVGVWSVVQWAAAAAVNATIWPMTAAVVGIGLLVGAVIYAYKNFEGFRNLVNTVGAAVGRAAGFIAERFRTLIADTGRAFGAIKGAAQAVGNWFTGTVVPGFKSALSAIGGAFRWLNTNAVQPVMGLIRGAISGVSSWFTGTIVPNFQKSTAALGKLFDFLYRNFIAPFVWLFRMAILGVSKWFRDTIVPLLRAATNAVGAAFNRLLNATVRPVWAAIRSAINAVSTWFKNVLFPAFRATISALATAFRVFKDRTVTPVWTGIRATINTVGNWFRNVLAPIFRAAIQSLQDKFNAFRTGVRTVWDAVRNVLSSGWTHIRTRVFDPLKAGLGTLRDSFTRTKDGIATAWDKLKAKVKEPISFVVNKVINPFIGGYNKLNNFWGGDDLSKIEGFARGGVIPGYQAAKKDDRLIPMRSGEGVLVPEAVRGIGADAVHTLNKAGNAGGATAARNAWRGMHAGTCNHDNHAAAPSRGPLPGADPWIWGGFQEGIQSKGSLSVYSNGVPAAWNLSSAARMWDGVAGVDVGMWRNNERNGQILAANESNTVPFPSIPNWVGYYGGSNIWLKQAWREQGKSGNVLRAVAAHEIGHSLGLGHVHHANSIMNPTIGGGTYSPTAVDVRNLQTLYPGGSGKAKPAGSANVDDGNVWLDQLKNIVTGPIDKAKSAFKGNKFAQMPLGLADKLVEGVIDKAASLIGLGGGDSGPAGNDQVTKWMTKALKMKGLFSEANLASGVRRAMQESNGDPSAINKWDSNWLAGNPSKGLMQVVQTTFNDHMEKGFGDIWKPLDNILASINYTIARYGSLKAGWDLPGGYARGGIVGERPKLYDQGGLLHEGVQLIDHQRSQPDRVLTARQWDAMYRTADAVSTSGTGPLVQNLYAFDADEAMRKLEHTRKKQEALYVA